MKVVNPVMKGKTLTLPEGTSNILKIYTSNDTFVVPETGKYKITVFGKGGDGGWAYANNQGIKYSSGGGGAGGVAISVLSLTKGESYSVTVTAASSSFGSLLSAVCGSPGGDVTGYNGGAGGTASGGNILSESGGSGSTGTNSWPYYGGNGGGYSDNAVSKSPFASSSGGSGGGNGNSPSASKTKMITEKGYPAFGTGGGGGGYYTYSINTPYGFGSDGMSGAVIIEVITE